MDQQGCFKRLVCPWEAAPDLALLGGEVGIASEVAQRFGTHRRIQLWVFW